MYGLLSWLLFGLAAGAIARLIVKGPHNFGCLSTSVLGVVGSLVGGILGNLITGNKLELEPSGFIGAVIGSVLLLAGVKIFTGNRH